MEEYKKQLLSLAELLQSFDNAATERAQVPFVVVAPAIDSFMYPFLERILQ
ncbi:hypothetical protein KDW_50970 [Dictyobacter vulcani]|uniref:Uncharacterized protein n=1 Tax=Dictyobacter vulcani TaxID=2607529 RepID=A0A5J4KSS3_9CHLR|nr:hypothetical protein KDW_50970 [Dictyobacter vulcani]